MHGSPVRSTLGAVIGFTIGVLSVSFYDRLPDDQPPIRVAWLLACACLAAVAVHRRRVQVSRVRPVLYTLAMITFGAWAGHQHAIGAAHRALAKRAPTCVDGVEILVRGRVTGLPDATPAQVRFDLRLTSTATVPGCTRAPLRRIRTTWYTAHPVEPGEIWTFRLKLRSIRGFQNPGGFDYEAHLLERQIDAVATVRAGRRVSGPAWATGGFPGAFDTMRQRIAAHVASWKLEHRGILLALTTGDAREIPDTDWELLRRTGTVHLMVISGMHISLAAGAGFVLGQLFARLFPPLLGRLPAQHLGGLVGVLLATLYSGLAGAGIPVQRAWVATVVVVFALLAAKRTSLWLVYFLVLAVVLVYDALAALDVGFWLSFGAVAVLIVTFAPRIGRRSTIEGMGRAQTMLFFAMLPISAVVLGQVPWVAPFANLFAVPLTSLVVLPLLAGGLLVEACFGFGGFTFWGLADDVIAALFVMLRAIDVFPPTALAVPGFAAQGAAAVAAVLWILPVRWSARLIATLGFLPLWRPVSAVAPGEVRVSVLDVGQGQAVMVDTARHRLLYDAGPRHLSGFDLGRAVVVPAFLATGRSTLDVLMLSHGDLDHVGGAAAVRDALSPRAVLAGSETPEFERAVHCRAGDTWQWDGVRFRILHPHSRGEVDRNDQSCVLMVYARGGNAVLPGDIGSTAERTIVAGGVRGSVALVVVPHHGSRFSSSTPWIVATDPRWAVSSAGHMNRFGHPHSDTVDRYRKRGARFFTTAESGALVWYSRNAGSIVEWRYHTPPYWRVSERL